MATDDQYQIPSSTLHVDETASEGQHMVPGGEFWFDNEDTGGPPPGPGGRRRVLMIMAGD